MKITLKRQAIVRGMDSKKILDTAGDLGEEMWIKNTVTRAGAGTEERQERTEFPQQRDTQIEGGRGAWKVSLRRV